jgi:hypothetical protein
LKFSSNHVSLFSKSIIPFSKLSEGWLLACQQKGLVHS